MGEVTRMDPLKKGEREIMDLFWKKDCELTHADICDALKDTMSRNTVYLHLNHLIDKGALQIGPSIRRGRTYGRTFLASISKTEYYAKQVEDAAQEDDTTLEAVFSYFLGSKDVTNEVLDKLEERIQQKRKELNG